jgi:hypothetical protein
MAGDINGAGNIRSSDLARLVRGEIVLSSMAELDHLDDVFGEWDESAPIAQLARGSHPNALPGSARTSTLSASVNQAVQPRTKRRRTPTPTTLEAALLDLTNGVPELISSDY